MIQAIRSFFRKESTAFHPWLNPKKEVVENYSKSKIRGTFQTTVTHS